MSRFLLLWFWSARRWSWCKGVRRKCKSAVISVGFTVVIGSYRHPGTRKSINESRGSSPTVTPPSTHLHFIDVHDTLPPFSASFQHLNCKSLPLQWLRSKPVLNRKGGKAEGRVGEGNLTLPLFSECQTCCTGKFECVIWWLIHLSSAVVQACCEAGPSSLQELSCQVRWPLGGTGSLLTLSFVSLVRIEWNRLFFWKWKILSAH